MKPPHYLIQKCQKLSQLLSSWTLASKVAPTNSHHEQMKHNDYQNLQAIWHFYIGGKEPCVHFAT